MINKIHKCKFEDHLFFFVKIVRTTTMPPTPNHSIGGAHKSIPWVYSSLASPRAKATGMSGGTAIQEQDDDIGARQGQSPLEKVHVALYLTLLTI